jgi:hypothetical protein
MMRRLAVLALAASLCLAARAEGQEGPARPQPERSGPQPERSGPQPERSGPPSAQPGPQPFGVFVTVSGGDDQATADAYASISTALAASPLVFAVYNPSSSANPTEGAAIKLYVDVLVKRNEESDSASWTIGSRSRGAALAEGEAERSSSSPACSDTTFWRPLVEGLTVASEKAPAEAAAVPTAPTPPAPRWAIDSSLYSFAFPELRASYSPSPSWLVRATITQFLFGLSFTDAAGGSYPSLVYSTGLVQAGFGAGWLPLGGKGSLQPYLGLDAFLRLIFPDGGGMGVEPVAPLGIAPFVGLEWSRTRGVGVFLELGATLYPFAAPDYMRASAMAAGSSQLLFGGSFSDSSGWFGEFPDLRFGLRFKP